MEKAARKRAFRRNLKVTVLEAISMIEDFRSALVRRRVFTLLDERGLPRRKYDGSNIDRARKQLVADGSLVYENSKLRLTKKGETLLRKREMQMQTTKARRWDGRWRVLIFDIPEYRKSLREKIRRTLISIGFERLQDSVWVYPHDCEDLITLLKADLRVGKDVQYMIVDEIENDRSLRKRFELRTR